MIVDRRVIGLLRLVLIALFGVLLVFQTLSFPGKFRYEAQQHPDQAYLRWPLTLTVALLILSVEVAVVCTWRLLSLVRDDRIFSEASARWTDALVWSIGVGWVVFAVLAAIVALNADDPGPVMILFFVTVGYAAFGLLVVVLRNLLRQATGLRSDMEGVI